MKHNSNFSSFLTSNMKTSHLIICIISASWIKGITALLNGFKIKSTNNFIDYRTGWHLVIFFTGVYLSKEVYQTPVELLGKTNTEVKLSLTHKIQNYDTILWYQRSPGDTSLKLIGYMYYKTSNVEPEFQSSFNVSGDGEKAAHLHILQLKHPKHTGDYFGAASRHSTAERASVVQKPPDWWAEQQKTSETTRLRKEKKKKWTFLKINHPHE